MITIALFETQKEFSFEKWWLVDGYRSCPYLWNGIIPEANHTWFLKRMAFRETDITDWLSSTPLSIRRLSLRQRQDEDNTWVTLWAIQTKNKIGSAIINYLLFIMIHSFFSSKFNNPIIFKDSSSDSYIARQKLLPSIRINGFEVKISSKWQIDRIKT